MTRQCAKATNHDSLQLLARCVCKVHNLTGSETQGSLSREQLDTKAVGNALLVPNDNRRGVQTNIGHNGTAGTPITLVAFADDYSSPQQSALGCMITAVPLIPRHLQLLDCCHHLYIAHQ